MADADPRWSAVAAELTWDAAPTTIYEPDGRFGRWFVAGSLNVATNCVDRHISDRPAIHWEGEPGDQRTLTFRELADEVAAMATALRAIDLGPGDRVGLHLGWVPEAAVAMLACARIGAPFAVIPVPLPVEALAERLDSLAPRVVITQDGAWRHGTIIPTKSRMDDALTASSGVQHTVVLRRTGLDVAWYEGDRWLHDLLAAARRGSTEREPALAFPAEHPLLLTWNANRRGRPVVAVHGTATLLAAATAVHRYGLSAGGVFWCAAELAWIPSQTQGVLGPLAWGDTAVMFEGMLDTPNHRRLWEVIERYGVTTLLTTPSVLRRVRSWTETTPAVGLLRRLVAMAEPFHPELRAWLAERITADPDNVADAWGQIELGGVVTVDRPIDAERFPDPGLDIVDPIGKPVPDGTAGEVVLRRPWAGTVRAVEGVAGYDHWGHRSEVYATGDRAVRHAGSRLEFLGRIDPVVSISGQLVSLAEIRDVLLEHPFLIAAEVVAVPDARLGSRLVACVVPADAAMAGPGLAAELVTGVQETLGGLARPRTVLFVDHFGGELTPDTLRRALGVVAASVSEATAQISWEKVRAASTL